MNGLTLRINPSGTTKSKNLMNFEPIPLPSNYILESENTLYNDFLQSTTVDEQLEILKKIIYSGAVHQDAEFFKFLAIIFLQAVVKHPIKCFLTRHITRNETMQKPFTNQLAQFILDYTSDISTEYHLFIGVVSKIATCIENFPAGTAAVKMVEIQLATYLKACLECSVHTLSNSKTISPTEKNEVYNLIHLSLRLLLYIVQKVNDENTSTLTTMFDNIRACIKYIFFDGDAPMDTKTISGILYVSMEILEKGPDSWLKILDASKANSYATTVLRNDSAQLALFSAIATVVSVHKLQTHRIADESALIHLTRHINDIGQRSSSESVFTLGVTRTLVQISKMLNSISDNNLGQELVDRLLVFVWGHLEHYMDSVRHLTAQVLSNVVRYCTRIEKDDNAKALTHLFHALSSLERSRKSYYISLCALTAQLGASRIMLLLPDVINDIIRHLRLQAVQASATIALETLLQKHVRESNAHTLYEKWIVPILHHVGTNTLDSSVLNILENLMSNAIVLDQNIINYIIPHIKESCDPNSSCDNLKCILLLLSVARKSGVINKLSTECKEGEWKGVISYEVLKMAAIDAVEETRILSLSLVCESPKTTEEFSPGDFELVLWYLKYNGGAQSPNFRQLTLSVMKKFTKRLEESYKVLNREKEVCADSHKVDYYLSFVERLRRQCFNSLLPGANYSRRFVALQVLAWIDDVTLEGYQRDWKEEYIDKLLLHLEDSYENNKALALRILDRCPSEYIKGNKYRVSLELEVILKQASSLKPTECVSAAYKLMFLKNKLPEHIIQETDSSLPEAVSYHLASALLRRVRSELHACQHSVVAAARHAPMYGQLHCVGHLLQYIDHTAISSDGQWKRLVEEVVSTCILVSQSVACVVADASPEGLPPAQLAGLHDEGNSGNVRLEDGRPVTAQMVLLCAWRSVKEVSLLLGTIASRFSIEGEGGAAGSLSQQQLADIGEHFAKLLAHTKHRGAFEQAYVGFTKLLARLWSCRSRGLHGRPRLWLARHAAAAASASASASASSATRRSAGLPFMIQALVTTELQVQGNPKCLHEIMTILLKLAQRKTISAGDKITIDCDESLEEERLVEESNESQNANTDLESLSSDGLVESRTHSLNILRALFRSSALEENMSGYVGEGLMVALSGFEGDTWMERNSATLAFSALMGRVFTRRTMTGRIFFLRYPALYDFILNKLSSLAGSDAQQLGGCACACLLLCARLQPSALDGCASSLSAPRLAPLVRRCGAAPAHAARRLAAAAVLPLTTPTSYISNIESMLSIIAEPSVKRNHCHGVLLQLTKLLGAKPEDLLITDDSHRRIVDTLLKTYWILEQGTCHMPCYLIIDEYVKMINLIVWRFPTFLTPKMLQDIKQYLHQIVFSKTIPPITFGREICLSNCIYLYIIILNKVSQPGDITEIIFKGLEHGSYDVVLNTLNYLLTLYEHTDIDKCDFLEHLSMIRNENVKEHLRQHKRYIESLCNVMRNNGYMECMQKALKILSLEKDTQRPIIAVKQDICAKEISNEDVIRHLFDYIQNEHENLTHIFLECLSNFVTDRLDDSSLSCAMILDVIRVIFACSSSENNDSTRSVVAKFLEKNYDVLIKLNLETLAEKEKFEFRATLLSTVVTTLEDDEPLIRQRVSDVISRCHGNAARVVSPLAGEVLRAAVGGGEEGKALLVLLALLDFKSEVCITDEINDECRVFDQNERYNIFLEETVWTSECVNMVISLHNGKNSVIDYIRSVIDNPVFTDTFDKLCNNNLVVFKKMLNGDTNLHNYEVLNPKIELFINLLQM